MKDWKNILIKVMWSILGAALIVLFVIAWKAKSSKKVNEIQVELVGETKTALFMDEKEIVQILKDQGITIGTLLEGVHLSNLEKNLEKIKWIKNAELFIDNQQLLQVQIEQRIPIARVFTMMGGSFYIDEAGWKLPLKQLTVLRLPVFTGFPTDQDQLSSPDSLMLQDILLFSKTIKDDSFFTSQIAQINLEANGEFQLIPSLGDHTVLIGTVENLEDKLNRLFTFYKNVWVHSGINAYQVLDCRFDKQVIALKKGLQPIQYTSGVVPLINNFILSDSVVSTLKENQDPPKNDSLLQKRNITIAKVNKSENKKGKKIKKMSPTKNNKQNNKALNIKKQSAKALMPTKTTSKNNNN